MLFVLVACWLNGWNPSQYLRDAYGDFVHLDVPGDCTHHWLNDWKWVAFQAQKGPPKFISFLPKKRSNCIFGCACPKSSLAMHPQGVGSICSLCRSLDRSDSFRWLVRDPTVFHLFQALHWMIQGFWSSANPSNPSNPPNFTTPCPPKPSFTAAANNLGPGLCKALVTCYVRTSSADAPCMWLPSRRIRRSRGAGSVGRDSMGRMVVGWWLVAEISSAQFFSEHL